jgi:membrane protein DedA with SNARE-associated domain
VPTSFVSSWGAWAVFFSVLATQLGIPVPAAPVLIFAGMLIATGAGSFSHTLLAAGMAAFASPGCLMLS